MLLRENLGWRHEGHLKPVLHRNDSGQQCDDRFPGSHVSLQQAVHRLRPGQVVHDFLDCGSLSGCKPEGQGPSRRLPNPVVDMDGNRLTLGLCRLAAGGNAQLKEKGLFEDQPLLRWRREAVERLDRCLGRRKVGGQKGRGAPRETVPLSDRLRQVIGKIAWKSLQRVEQQPPLNLRCQATHLLVHRNNSSRVNGLGILLLEHLVLWIGQLKPAGSPLLEKPEQHHMLAPGEDVA